MNSTQRKPHAEPAPKPSEEQLALAYRQLYHPHWPTTLEAALQHKLYGPAIRGLASTVARAAVCTPARTLARHARAAAQAARKAPAFDARRAAANDLEDDDETA